MNKFVWRDLMTKDLDKSKAFYEGLFGWEIKSIDMGGGFPPYNMIHAGGEGIGGFVPLEADAPSHWVGYVSVDDVDAACERATANGGQVCVPGTDIPNVGRFAVVTDPTGGVISPYTHAGEPGPDREMAPVGHFCWEEMLTNDVPAVRSFYSEVFGWAVEEMDMGPAGMYTIFKSGEKMVAGAIKMPPDAQAPPHWLSYIHVEDVDAATEKAKGLGATNYCPPMDIPNIGRFSVNADPTGAMFALFKYAEAPG